jgi:hypothetical protein
MSAIELILSRLPKYANSGKNRYIAPCPAHDDRSPSLSITEATDGRVLIHCFAGCPAMDVVESIGLTLADLYPPDSPDYNINQKPLIRGKQTELTVDQWVLELCKDARKQGKKISVEDLERERQAFMRVNGGGK